MHAHWQVFYRAFHMHGIGQRMVTRQYRSASSAIASAAAELVRTDSVEFYDFNLQVLQC
jgi:hypothetical protein